MRTPDLTAAYGGRRVFVTGHTGFKGSWLCVWLESLGAAVHGYALEPPTTPSAFEACGVASLLAGDERADVRDAERLRAALEAAAPDVVLHLAAQSLVRPSYEEPAETFATNVQGTVNLLEAVRRRGAPCTVVVVTSDKCYENTGRAEGYREGDPLGGHDPYSASKGAAEIATASYRRSFFDPARLGQHGVKLASARAGNVIGGGDWAVDRLVPDVVAALAAGRPAPVRNPSAVRPWQHVLESLGGYLHLGARLLLEERPSLCAAWNFGPRPSSDATVGELAQQIVTAWGSGSLELPEEPDAVHEAHVLRLDITRAATVLGWRPRWDLGSAVQRTVAWARAHHAGAGPGELLRMCREDIAAYCASVEEGAVR